MGSARSNGNTKELVDRVTKNLQEYEFIDLLKSNITGFDYVNKNINYDFPTIIENFGKNHDILILATPIYWYNISGVMKNFIDRFTNLLYNHKELGKGLENKSLYVIASFTGEEPREYISEIFSRIAKYFKMQ